MNRAQRRRLAKAGASCQFCPRPLSHRDMVDHDGKTTHRECAVRRIEAERAESLDRMGLVLAKPKLFVPSGVS